MWVLNNVASSLGDPNQRLTSWFLRALICRTARVSPTLTAMNCHATNVHRRCHMTTSQCRSMSVTELADYVDLIPWHRFGFCASNGAICKATRGHSKVHILDLSITHGMQWPTLIDALAKRPEGPPSLRITVPSARPPVPPLLNASTEQVYSRLANFAKSRDVPFEFRVMNIMNSSSSDPFMSFHLDEFLLTLLNPSLLDVRDDEALVINCQNWLRYLPDEIPLEEDDIGIRDRFLEMIRSLNPHIVVVVDEDAELDSPSLASRITSCVNYLWIPFDALETFLPKESAQRMEYEACVGHKIENIIGYEGMQRIERLETGAKTTHRMKKAHFASFPFCDETVREVKCSLDEHASGWGMKREDEMLVLTWKGHNSVFATAWVPATCC
ncbi:hypothetical protein Syun_027080 [Stephania yunnanensis]|uniref:Scarecrow-like protein 32 n=1 Tax=Stephania yunnanensis TaxID=152371 RepID=A0AAP0ENR7_9MAGN